MPAKRPKSARPLWTCPKCGLKFVTKNLWHSCRQATLADWKKRMGPGALALYDRFESLIANCGEYYPSPAKTRITFMGRVRFAGITKIDDTGMTCNFAMAKPLSSKRFVKVYEIVPGWWVHQMRITDPEQLDEQVQRWIRRAYATVGTHGVTKRRPGGRV
jgi:hypothetical protein